MTKKKTVKKIRIIKNVNAWNYNPEEHAEKVSDKPSETVKGETYSIKDLVTKHKVGNFPNEVMREPEYTDDLHDLEDQSVERPIDITEVYEQKEVNEEKIKELEQKVKDSKTKASIQELDATKTDQSKEGELEGAQGKNDSKKNVAEDAPEKKPEK